MMQENALLEYGIGRLFVLYVVPSVISMVLVGIQGMVDGIFLGNFSGTNAIASINIASPFLQLVLGVSFIVCTGALSYLGRTLGRGDKAYAKHIFRTAIISITAIQICVLAAGCCFPENIAIALGANEMLLAGSRAYILIIALFAPIISFMVLCGFVCRLVEKPHYYLVATLVCLLCNIALNYVFIVKFKWEVAGAAFATGLSYFAGLLIVIRPFITKFGILNVFEGSFKWEIIAHIALNGSSEGVNYIATAFILYIFNMAFIGMAGTDGVAAFTIINYIGLFTTTIMFGISDGIGPIISSNCGAGRFGHIRKTMLMANIISFIFGLAAFFTIYKCGNQITAIFIDNNDKVIQLAGHGAIIYASSFLFTGYNIIQSGYHTSIGNSLLSVIIATCRGILFIFIGIKILPYLFGIAGIWATFTFSEIMTCIICLLINLTSHFRPC